jgi:hypothetical protein
MPGVGLEDPFLFQYRGQYHMILEDNEGKLSGSRKNGVHLASDNARDWRVFDVAPVAYRDTISWTDGTRTTVERRERPWLLLENGEPAYLITAIMVDKKTRSVVQRIR